MVTFINIVDLVLCVERCVVTFNIVCPLVSFCCPFRFDGLFGLIVVLNALAMGLEFSYPEDHWGNDVVIFNVVDLVFLFLFTVELALRLTVGLFWDDGIMIKIMVCEICVNTKKFWMNFTGTGSSLCSRYDEDLLG